MLRLQLAKTIRVEEEGSLQTNCATRSRFNAAPALFLLSVLALPIGVAMASQYLMPSRDLSDDERLSQSVGLSDAICQARVLSVSDSSRPIGGGGWTHDVELVLRPVSWITGHDDRDSIRVGIDYTEADRFRKFVSEQGPDAVAVFFLVQTSRDAHARQMTASIRPTDQDWVLLGDPYGVREGMLRTPALDKAALARVRDQVTRHSLSARSRASDLVVIASFLALESPKDRRERYACTIRVDSLIAGSSAARTITFRAPTMSDFPNHSTLMFLRREAGSTFTVVAPATNEVVRDGVLAKSGTPIESAIREIRAARKAIGNRK